jgi:tetratricopeptide (TPR) repeat protein
MNAPTFEAVEATSASPVPVARDRFRRRRGGRFLVLAAALTVAAAGTMPAFRWWKGRRTEQYRVACQAAMHQESWDRLRAASSQWLEWDESSDDARIFLAEASVQLSDTETAVELLGSVDDSYHGALQALALQGDFLFSDLNRPNEAVEAWKRMLEINPHADLARQRLIYFYAMTLEREKMIKHIRRAMELGCEPPEAYGYLVLAYEVMFSDGLRVTNQWLEAEPDDPAFNVANAIYLARFSPENTVNIYGMSLIVAGDETLVNDCLEKYPSNLEVLAFHIDKAIVAGDRQRVLELLTQSPPEAERDVRFWRYRGWYLAALDRFSEAEEALRTGLELHPFDWRTRLVLAGVLRQLDRPQEAAEAARVADFGKELDRELLQLPDARAAFNAEISPKMEEYLRLCGDPMVLRAWERRTQ